MYLARFAAMIPIVLSWAPGYASAQTEPRNASAPPRQASPPTPPPDGAGDSARVDEVVITAQRYGEAKVPAETELGEAEIAGYGADDINELVQRLGPLAGGAGEEPVILVNGEEVGFDRSVLDYPAEALSRVAILRPDAAAQYGHSSGRRVVNLVLKKSFASRNGNLAVSLATRGGQYGGNLTASQVAIAGPVRWNVQARMVIDSALPKRVRNPPPGTIPGDAVGYITGLDYGEIDPALSRLAGRFVTVAAIPGTILTQAPTLGDFTGTANVDHPADPAASETLRPSRRNLSLRMGATRPLGPFSASLSINAVSNRSSGRRGLPMASIVLPAGSPWSPFAADIRLVRPLSGGRALRTESRSESLGLALTLSGAIAGWQTSLAASYTRNWSGSLLERGIDTARIQGPVDRSDAAFNPYAPWSDSLLLADRSRTHGETLNVRLNVAKPVVRLPAGSVTASLAVNAGRNRTTSRRTDNLGDMIGWDRRNREQADVRLALGIPLARRGQGAINALGDLALDLSAGGQVASGSRAQKRYAGGVIWSPAPVVQFRGSFEHEDVVPSFEQLDAPRLETTLRIYDLVRQEAAEPLWITGGNPLLRSGSRQSLTFNALVRPFGSEMLTINAGYREHRGTGGVTPFPELTPAIEAAFPDRIARDAAGRLVAVDARAINIASQSDVELYSGIALRLPDPAPASSGGAVPRAADPLRISFSLNHRWRLKSELLTRAGAPVIDQLADSGQSRHLLSLQAVAGKRSFGADVSATWSNAARVRSRNASVTQPDYRYTPPILVNLGLFIDPENIWPDAKQTGLLKRMRISLDIDNLLDTYRRVTHSDGTVPAGYSRDEIDPLGRIIRISVRKRF